MPTTIKLDYNDYWPRYLAEAAVRRLYPHAVRPKGDHRRIPVAFSVNLTGRVPTTTSVYVGEPEHDDDAIQRWCEKTFGPGNQDDQQHFAFRIYPNRLWATCPMEEGTYHFRDQQHAALFKIFHG